MTEEWLKRIGATEEDARKMGVLPEQQKARARRVVAIMTAAGHEHTQECDALKWQGRHE